MHSLERTITVKPAQLMALQNILHLPLTTPNQVCAATEALSLLAKKRAVWCVQAQNLLTGGWRRLQRTNSVSQRIALQLLNPS